MSLSFFMVSALPTPAKQAALTHLFRHSITNLSDVIILILAT
jgi:hypothetical protein